MNDESFPQSINYYISKADVQKINEKVEQLYRERVLPFAGNISAKLKQNLIDLQRIVFIIDHYGENNIDINPILLALLFNQAAMFIEGLGIDRETSKTLLNDMTDYANIEISMRFGKKLADYDIEFFYRKKSSDVRMLRNILHIIKDEHPVSVESDIQKDILEEIIDDIDDIDEDKLTPLNGNRLLEIINDRNYEKLNEYILLAEFYFMIYPQHSNKIIRAITTLIDNLSL